MAGEDFFSYNEEEFSSLAEHCEKAYNQGILENNSYSEEEFEYLLDYFVDSMDDDIVYKLSSMAYQQHPYSLDMMIRYCDVLIVNSEHEKAFDILLEQLYLNPSNKDINFLVSRVYIKKEEPDKAFEYLENAISLSLESELEMLVTAAQDFIDILSFDYALTLLQRAESLTSDSPDIINDIAFCYERKGELVLSMNYYQRYLDIDPFNDNVWFNVGTIYARELKFDEALEAFDFALALNGDNSSVLYNKAILLINTGKYNQGIELFKEFLFFEPDNIFALLGIADAYLVKKDLDTSMIYFKQITEIDSSNTEANTAIAYISMHNSDFYSAIMYLRKLAGNAFADYNFITGEILSAYKKSKDPEFLLFYLMSLYYLKKRELFYIYLDTLLEYEDIWLAKLYEIIPVLSKDDKITRHIKEKRGV